MSSSEEDLPLSALKNSSPTSRRSTSRRSSRSSAKPTTSSYKESSDDDEEFEFDENAEDPMDEEESEEEDEDDIPLSELVKKASPKAKKTKAAPKSKAKPKAKATPKKKKVVKKKVVKKKSSSSSTIVSHSSELYAKSEKGKLISELLCRWWYVITWPEPESFPLEMPPNSDTMDGFPGVYVVTSGAEVGKILDFRNKDTCPNFNNMLKKSSKEIQELLIKAIKAQQQVLIESEGPGTKTEKDLKELLRWAKKVNPKTSDAEARKVLKAAGLSTDY